MEPVPFNLDKVIDRSLSMYYDLTYAREARWDILDRMNKLTIEDYHKRQLFSNSIKSISKTHITCKYCGTTKLRWADTTNGYRLVNLGNRQHICKQETKSE